MNNVNKNKVILLAAGGTGGHLFPAIAVSEELVERGYIVHLITDKRCEKYLTKDLKLIVHIINFKINRNSLFRIFQSIFCFIFATMRALNKVKTISPAVVIGFGGYPSLPTMISSILLRRPIIIHEQNSILGKTNLSLSRFAKIVAISYNCTKDTDKINKEKIVVTGDIIRKHISAIKPKTDFEHPEFRIFVTGGSQGAKIFTTLIPEILTLIAQERSFVKISITQQAQAEDIDKISAEYKILGLDYNLSPFFHDISNQYSQADLFIGRSGAMTIAEIKAIGLPAIFIPYPYSAKNHQFYNAKAIENQGGGWCFEQKNISARQIADKILELIDNRLLLKKASLSLSTKKTEGSRILADTVIRIMNK